MKASLLVKHIILYSVILLSYCLQSSAQDQSLSNWRTQWIATAEDSIQLDTLSIVPKSVLIKDGEQIIPLSDYEVLHGSAQLIWKNKPTVDSLAVSYRVFSFSLSKKFARKKSSVIQRAGDQPLHLQSYTLNKKQGDIFDLDGLDYSGSFSRGISFGNSQDLVVNSNFNLQMAGKLRNDVEVLAAITDNNIPFQPEGNTQQIQDFDQVYIQLKKGKSTLLLGDYELLRPDTYFLNFNKKLQGVSFSSAYHFDEKRRISGSASVAIAKGKFARNIIQPLEGNQGPYKLRGANNELYIIVLSASERVFIDGQEMKRGTEFDYTIDYNSAEVSFTNHRLITKDSRIVVEFEYSNINYLRTTSHMNTTYQSDKLKLQFNFYGEGDNKNQPIFRESLSEFEKETLRSVGDNLDQAFISGIVPLSPPYPTDRVLYIQKDTLSNGVNIPIFQYAVEESETLFTLSFTDVGEGNGNYVLSDSGINGRIYEWVAADSLTQAKQGRFEPISVLVSPKRRRMITVGADYQISSNGLLKAEWALSNNDINTFSDLDQNDNNGTAAKLAYSSDWKLSKAKKINLQVRADYEYVNEDFNVIERYRLLEFERNWNVLGVKQKTDEHIINGGFSLIKDRWASFDYEYSKFNRVNYYNGDLHKAKARIDKNGWNMQFLGSYLTSSDSLFNTRFIRPKLSLSKSFNQLNGWTLGGIYEGENNLINQKAIGKLTNQSFNFDQYTAFIEKADSGMLNWRMKYILRTDENLEMEELSPFSTGHTFNLSGRLGETARHQLIWDFSYRELELHRDTIINENQSTILGKLQYNWVAFNGFVRSSTLYQVSSGQTQVIDYEYAPDVNGNYFYRDLNDNGIRELNEFLLLNENDLTYDTLYRRVLLPTDEYVKTNNLLLNQSLAINPKAKWFEKTGVRKMLALFATQTNWQINRKLPFSNDWGAFNPFANTGIAANDSTSSSISSSLRNTLYFNRSHAKFGVDLYQNNIYNEVILLGGSDSRRKTEEGIKVRYNISKKLSTKFQYLQERQNSISLAIIGNNYRIDGWELRPSITYIDGAKLRLTASYRYKNSISQSLVPENMEGEIPATIHQFSLESKYSWMAQRNISANLSFAQTSFEGDPSAPYVYEMLDSFQDGNNYLWSIAYDTKLGKQLQLSLIYDGRKSGDNAPRHVGRAQLRAIF